MRVTEELQTTIQDAIDDAKRRRHEFVTLDHLLAAMLRNPRGLEILRACSADPLRLGRALERFFRDQIDPLPDEEGSDDEGEGPQAARDPLRAYTVNLVERAAAGQIDPLIGRAAELTRTIQVLCRRRKNNPVFVGEPGVGKTAIVEGLALA